MFHGQCAGKENTVDLENSHDIYIYAPFIRYFVSLIKYSGRLTCTDYFYGGQ